MRTKKLLACFLAVCMMFSAVPTVSAENAEHQHTYTDDVLKEATCEKTGILKQTCSSCGDAKYAIIPVAAHTPGDDAVIVEATCVEPGSESYTCTVCKKTINREIPATGEHTYGETATDATCTEPAKAGYFCTVCGAEDPKRPAAEVGEALGHTRVSEILEADCVNNEREVVSCEVCKEELEVIDLYEAGVGEKATGHSWGEWTSNEDGTHSHTCETCQESEDADCAYETEVTEATCSSYKTTTYTCSDCGYSYEEIDEEGGYDESKHVYEEMVLKEATCDKNGVGKYVCTCGAANGYFVIEAGHNWGEVEVTTEATCTEAGKGTRTCGTCQETEEVEIPAIGHQEDYLIKKEPTCGEPGIKQKFCTVCFEEFGEPEEIPATGKHTYNKEEIVIDATCTEPAKAGYFCTVCGAEDPERPAAEVGEALGHTRVSE
ncbi:MAG: hypothetical protein Q4C50_08865, partial [Eubacteriales bacterium]|nr:hypothetical protein [Eubacteriales bacterium]